MVTLWSIGTLHRSISTLNTSVFLGKCQKSLFSIIMFLKHVFRLLSWIALISGSAWGKRASPDSPLSDILDGLEMRSDNRIRPTYGERALEIQAFAFIRNIIEINEVQSTVTLSLLLMQMWEDPRLKFDPVKSDSNENFNEILIDSPEFMSRLWNPDTFIVNEVKTHNCMSFSEQRNLANQIIRLNQSGGILKTSRLTVSVSCPMQLQKYPFHGFKCDVELESFGHKTSDILFLWRNGSMSADYSKIDVTSLATKTSYSLMSVETHSQQTYLDTGGSYSRLIIRFEFQKLWLRHAITFFIPTLVLTLGSILTLWLLDSKDWSGTGILTNFVIAGFIILLGSLEYSTTPLLAQVPLLTPTDFQTLICLTTVFAAVAYHGLSFCCRTKSSCNWCCCCSCCCTKDSGHKKQSKKRQSTSKKSASPRSEKKSDQDSITYTKVTCYDSYDVTDEDMEDDPLQTGRKEAGHHTRTQGASTSPSPIINDIIAGDNNQALPVTQTRKKSRKSTASKLLSIFLRLSKCITTMSFVLAEVLGGLKYMMD